jgi:hypothetical protein
MNRLFTFKNSKQGCAADGKRGSFGLRPYINAAPLRNAIKASNEMRGNAHVKRFVLHFLNHFPRGGDTGGIFRHVITGLYSAFTWALESRHGRRRQLLPAHNMPMYQLVHFFTRWYVQDFIACHSVLQKKMPFMSPARATQKADLILSGNHLLAQAISVNALYHIL